MAEPEVYAATTADAIRAAEAPALAEFGDDVLMDRAAAAVAATAVSLLDSDASGSRVVVLAGPGKNGGDALLAGALLAESGASVSSIRMADRIHERGLERLLAAGGAEPVWGGTPEARREVENADLVIDGIVGVGGRLGLGPDAAETVSMIPRYTPVVAVDVPSGLDPDSGACPDDHVRATVTVTFTSPKPCLFLPPAALEAGLVQVADVGIAAPDAPPDAPRRLTRAGARASWPRPDSRSHKYSRGVVGVVAGSDRFPGAAVLACAAAVRTGAGMVRYVGPRRVQDLVLAARPEVVATEPSAFLATPPKADAWVIGPGVGDAREQVAAMEAALASGAPLVVDADAVAWYATRGARSREADRVLLTPHAGELARALAALGVGVIGGEHDPVTGARTLATATGATVLLKGAVTLVATPEGALWSQADAPPWLATAGAGDVLAGVAGALLASGLPADRAGALAALVHGEAAYLASRGGPIAALDVAEALPAIVDGLRDAIREVLTGD